MPDVHCVILYHFLLVIYVHLATMTLSSVLPTILSLTSLPPARLVTLVSAF